MFKLKHIIIYSLSENFNNIILFTLIFIHNVILYSMTDNFLQYIMFIDKQNM